MHYLFDTTHTYIYHTIRTSLPPLSPLPPPCCPSPHRPILPPRRALARPFFDTTVFLSSLLILFSPPATAASLVGRSPPLLPPDSTLHAPPPNGRSAPNCPHAPPALPTKKHLTRTKERRNQSFRKRKRAKTKKRKSGAPRLFVPPTLVLERTHTPPKTHRHTCTVFFERASLSLPRPPSPHPTTTAPSILPPTTATPIPSRSFGLKRPIPLPNSPPLHTQRCLVCLVCPPSFFTLLLLAASPSRA